MKCDQVMAGSCVGRDDEELNNFLEPFGHRGVFREPPKSLVPDVLHIPFQPVLPAIHRLVVWCN